MIEGKPTVFISHSGVAKAKVAGPFKEFVDSLGLYGVLVGDEVQPGPGAADPGSKVNHFLDEAQMFVALATADDRTEGGEVHTRPNIILEIGAALERPHLARRVQIFKAVEVQLPSNLNPVYERLDPAHVEQTFATFERQVRAWGLLPLRPSGTPPAEPAGPEDIPTPSSDSESEGQSVGALLGLAAVIRGENDDRAAAIAARAHLTALTALSSRRSTEPLGVHELNGLYRDRASVTPDSGERQQLLRTVVVNLGAANAPGWYWLRDTPASELHARVAVLAMGEGDSRAMREAMNLLLHSSTAPPGTQLRSIVRSALRGEHGSGEVALKLLKKHGTRADLRVLADDLSRYTDDKPVAGARIGVQSRTAPAAALIALLESPGLLDSAIEEHLIAAARSLPDKSVRRALGSPAPPLRALALRILNASSRLRKADVEAIIEGDDDDSTRFLAADLAIRRRWRISDEQFERATKDAPWSVDGNELGVRFVGLKSGEELMEKLRWHGSNGYWIYEALGRWHFSLLEDRIESDLETDFAQLRDAERQIFASSVRNDLERRVEQKHGSIDEDQREKVGVLVDAAVEKYEEEWANVEEFILKRFRIAALAALSAHPSSSFARFGRNYLGDTDREMVSLAIQIVRQCGGEEDVSALKALCASSWGDLRVQAAEAALTLASDSRGLALELLAVEDANVVEVALDGLAPGELDQEEIKATLPLLDSEHLAIREIAAAFLLTRLDRAQLETLLDVYSEGHYYYSVMARIDRELYAPAWVKESARSILPN